MTFSNLLYCGCQKKSFLFFRVRVKTRPGETVCIVGDSPELGRWDPHHAIIMCRETKKKANDSEHPVSFEESPDEGYTCINFVFLVGL